MKRRFIVIINGLNANLWARDAITAEIKKNGLGWWHWYPDAWAVIDSEGTLGVMEFTKLLHAVAPVTEIMVFRVDSPAQWAAWGLPEKKEWFESVWMK